MYFFSIKKIQKIEKRATSLESRPHLAVVSSQVKIDSLRCSPVPPAVTRCERHPNNSSPVPCGEPALLIVPSPAHRLVLFALGDPAFPRKAEDVGVAAEDGTMFHGSQHPYWVTRLEGKSKRESSSYSIQLFWPFHKTRFNACSCLSVSLRHFGNCGRLQRNKASCGEICFFTKA